jgi:hypothetical protein
MKPSDSKRYCKILLCHLVAEECKQGSKIREEATGKVTGVDGGIA